jgi:hypothetical protein
VLPRDTKSRHKASPDGGKTAFLRGEGVFFQPVLHKQHKASLKRHYISDAYQYLAGSNCRTVFQPGLLKIGRLSGSAATFSSCFETAHSHSKLLPEAAPAESRIPPF